MKEVEEFARKLGVDTRRNGNVLYINGQILTAIYPGLDPINTFVSIVSAFVGAMWPYTLPGYLGKVNREWRQWRKKVKSKKNILPGVV